MLLLLIAHLDRLSILGPEELPCSVPALQLDQIFSVKVALLLIHMMEYQLGPSPTSSEPMPTDLHQILLVYITYVIAAGSPGPSNMRIMSVAMNEGRGPALAVASGVVSGSIFWGLMAATGVSALLTRYGQALVVLQILGGLYLLFLAYKAGRSALSEDKEKPRPGSDQKASAATLYKRGLLMHLTNPKSVLAWIAMMTLGLSGSSSTQTVAVILVGCAILSVTIFCGYAMVFSTAPMVRLYRRARRGIEGTLAVFFGFAGLKLLLTRI